MKRRMFVSSAVLATLGGTAVAQQSAGPITLVVPFPPGDALDATARAIADRAAAEMQRTIVVDNKPGASGFIAADSVARSANASTFLFGTTAMMAITPYLRKAPYSPADFTPVSRIATISTVFTVPNDFPAKTWPEFVALAKANPGKYTYASPGDGTIIHLQLETLQRNAGIKLLHVPYKGMGPALQDFLGGRIDVYTEPAVITHIKAGAARGLAVIGNDRLPELPGVPSLKEEGMPFDLSAWLGVFAPKSATPALVDRLGQALKNATTSADLGGKLPPGVQVSFEDRAAFASQIGKEQNAYKKLISDLDIKLD